MKKDGQENAWPELRFEVLQDTVATVQLWCQIAGKIRLKKMPWMNHSWHVALYVSARGLTTGGMPYRKGMFELEFDFIRHRLLVSTSEGRQEALELYPRPVASFYRELFDKLQLLGIEVRIHARPNEMDPAIPFAEDEVHHSYDPQQMHAYWKALVKVERVFNEFRARFAGKCSPVHLFWGAFDLAVTRFSGRTAPKHPGGAPNMPLKVMQEAYSHEVSSAGFWPGSPDFPHPAFYSYCYPTPEPFGEQAVQPTEAFYSKEMGEFFLLYDVVRQAPDPEAMLMQFLQSTYQAAATTGSWDKEALAFNFDGDKSKLSKEV